MSAGQNEPWTVLRLLQWTTEFFKKRGSESPRLDAEVLLAEARGCSRIELYTAFNSEPPEEVREAFREMVRRRADGTPVAYLVGHKEFYSIDLRVTEATLIPRPETEHLVIEAVDRGKEMLARNPDQTLRILDVGTGTGAIAIAVAKNLPKSELTAIDISVDALEIARYNVNKYELGDRIRLLNGNLLDPVREEAPFDILCSNPPYISQAEYDALAPGVRNYEPKQALLAGPTGTELIATLIDEGVNKINSGGWLILELSPMIAEQSAELVRKSGHYHSPRLIKDLAGHARILSAQRL